MRKRWSVEEDDFLKFALEQGYSVKEMECALDDRTQVAIRNRVSLLGLRKQVVAKEKNGLVRCCSCKQYKGEEDFFKLKNGKYYSYCNECRKEKSREKYLKAKEKRILEGIDIVNKSKVEANNNSDKRQCTKCKEVKNVDYFYWSVKGVELSNVCKVCRDNMNKLSREKRLRLKGY